MGSQSGGGYSSSPSSFDRLARNVDRLAKKYRLTPGGRFGEKGDNSRIIRSENPNETAREFWKALSKGGRVRSLPNGKGEGAFFDDGSHVVIRPITSTENSPAVSIRIMTKGRGIAPNQKIHFIPKGSHS
jgi:hypothetical protein